jgi:RNA polymerase sigma-70 factor (ECF subfamily)
LSLVPSETATQSGAGPSDAALVVAARARERWAEEALFRRHARLVNGLAYRLLGRDADVDDLVQDAFAAAFASLDRLENPQAFASWIASIVVRTAHKRMRRRRLLTRLGLRRDEPVDLDALVSPTVPPDVATELRAVYALVDRLPAEARIALVLRRVEGLQIDEIAARMNVSLATVKRRLALAESRLAKMISPGGAP